MDIKAKLKDVIPGALGTYLITDKLDAIRKTLAASLSKGEIVVRLADQEARTAAASADQEKRLAVATQSVLRLGEMEARLADQEARTAAASADHDKQLALATQEVMRLIRAEYTVMPRFAFHQPTDYLMDSEPPQFGPVVRIPGELLPLPAAPERYGYSAEDSEYLAWGGHDADLIRDQISRYLPLEQSLAIMDFGCSTGRVLRHFHRDHLARGWQLYGVDVQARCIEWLRRHFPIEFVVFTGTTLPTLPFADNSLDVIYGISVFIHIKYLWDSWLLELRRVLRPGGLLIQTIHTEHAWDFYHRHRQEDWVRENHSRRVYDTPAMDLDWFHYGDISVSQTFWKREVAREFWSRYLEVLDIMPPPEKNSFQDWIICRKPVGLSDRHN